MTNDQVKKFFDKRPSCKKFWLVGNMIFLKEERANEQANGKKVEVFTRKEVKIKTEAEIKAELEAEALKKAEEVKAAKVELNALDLAGDPAYDVMKGLVKVLEVETEGNKKADYITALTKFKEANKEE